MKFLLFGTGNYYERYKKWFPKADITALLDNSERKQNTLIDGIEVVAPKDGIQREYDAIIILSFYMKEMQEQLLKLGVPQGKIYHFYDLHQLLRVGEWKQPVQYYGIHRGALHPRHQSNNRILLLSQDLDLGGPALALYQAARALKRRGFEVAYASMIDGPLRDRLLQEKISVIVDVNMQIAVMEDCDWIKDFRLLICNTINFHVFLTKRIKGVPVIWWLHDSAFFYQGIKKRVLNEISMDHLTVCSVGAVPERAIHEVLPKISVKRLLYGVEDYFSGSRMIQKEICFITIGYIEYRKGQDILLKAIKLLPQEIRKQAKFYFVGQNTSMLAQEVIKQAKNIPEVIVTGAVDRDTVNEMLKQSDVMICPSREDPMPTVCAEAMMHGVPCLVSDAIGTAEYIRTGKNGLVFQNGNIKMLAEYIAWCVCNYKKVNNMRMYAREIYQKFFSVDVFERELLCFVNECITEGHGSVEEC